jgi:hypothetical protein
MFMNPSRVMGSQSSGIIFPYATTMTASSREEMSISFKAAAPLRDAGWRTSSPLCTAVALTGGLWRCMPRPCGLSGWVTTRRISWLRTA